MKIIKKINLIFEKNDFENCEKDNFWKIVLENVKKYSEGSSLNRVTINFKNIRDIYNEFYKTKHYCIILNNITLKLNSINVGDCFYDIPNGEDSEPLERSHTSGMTIGGSYSGDKDSPTSRHSDMSWGCSGQDSTGTTWSADGCRKSEGSDRSGENYNESKSWGVSQPTYPTTGSTGLDLSRKKGHVDYEIKEVTKDTVVFSANEVKYCGPSSSNWHRINA